MEEQKMTKEERFKFLCTPPRFSSIEDFLDERFERFNYELFCKLFKRFISGWVNGEFEFSDFVKNGEIDIISIRIAIFNNPYFSDLGEDLNDKENINFSSQIIALLINAIIIRLNNDKPVREECREVLKKHQDGDIFLRSIINSMFIDI